MISAKRAYLIEPGDYVLTIAGFRNVAQAHHCECTGETHVSFDPEPVDEFREVTFKKYDWVASLDSVLLRGMPSARVFDIPIHEPKTEGYWRHVFMVGPVSVVIDRLPNQPDGYLWRLDVQGTARGGFVTVGNSLAEVAGNLSSWLEAEEKRRRREETEEMAALKQQSEGV